MVDVESREVALLIKELLRARRKKRLAVSKVGMTSLEQDQKHTSSSAKCSNNVQNFSSKIC